MPVICSGDQGLAVPRIACIYIRRDSSWLEGLADRKKAQGFRKRSIITNPVRRHASRSYTVSGRARLRDRYSARSPSPTFSCWHPPGALSVAKHSASPWVTLKSPPQPFIHIARSSPWGSKAGGGWWRSTRGYVQETSIAKLPSERLIMQEYNTGRLRGLFPTSWQQSLCWHSWPGAVGLVLHLTLVVMRTALSGSTGQSFLFQWTWLLLNLWSQCLDSLPGRSSPTRDNL